MQYRAKYVLARGQEWCIHQIEADGALSNAGKLLRQVNVFLGVRKNQIKLFLSANHFIFGRVK